LPIEVDPDVARATVEEVRFWFHTFALSRAAGIYTPGAARDNRYRVATLPSDFGGMSVVDVGTFDGFYAFLAEHRGADRVVAVDNERYRLWVASRWGVELVGGEGCRAVHRRLGSAVEYRRMDAFDWVDPTSASTSSTASASSIESRTPPGCCTRCMG
jgi:tRNA (mo5U34)-methyltransferase